MKKLEERARSALRGRDGSYCFLGATFAAGATSRGGPVKQNKGSCRPSTRRWTNPGKVDCAAGLNGSGTADSICQPAHHSCRS